MDIDQPKPQSPPPQGGARDVEMKDATDATTNADVIGDLSTSRSPGNPPQPAALSVHTSPPPSSTSAPLPKRSSPAPAPLSVLSSQTPADDDIEPGEITAEEQAGQVENTGEKQAIEQPSPSDATKPVSEEAPSSTGKHEPSFSSLPAGEGSTLGGAAGIPANAEPSLPQGSGDATQLVGRVSPPPKPTTPASEPTPTPAEASTIDSELAQSAPSRLTPQPSAVSRPPSSAATPAPVPASESTTALPRPPSSRPITPLPAATPPVNKRHSPVANDRPPLGPREPAKLSRPPSPRELTKEEPSRHPGAFRFDSQERALGIMSASIRQDNRLLLDVDNAQVERQLNVGDALSYLDAVKVRFGTQPDVYNHFLDIMKDFKSELIDTPGVIRRVSTLFHGHPELIQGFNTFLPLGYRIDCSTNPLEPNLITVTTPSGTLLQTATISDPSMFGPGPLHRSDAHMSGFPGPSRPPSPRGIIEDHDIEMRDGDGSAMEPALQYVQKIKQRCDEATYRQFLEILGRYHTQGDVIDEREVSAEIARLFKDDPDLRSDFRVFMPERGGAMYDDVEEIYVPAGRRTRPGTPSRPRRGEPSTTSLLDGAAGSAPQKRKRRAEKEREREREREREQREREQREREQREREREAVTSVKASKTTTNGTSGLRTTQQPPPPRGPSPVAGPSNADTLSQDETHFFDRVRRLMPRETYAEFLRLINLFTQGFIDTGRLVRESGRYLGEGELARQLASILGWDEMDNRERFLLEETQHLQWLGRGNGPIVRPGRIRSNLQVGSYRKMPASEVNVPCSGRDEMCKSVLNDEWVSHPTWASEDTAGFVTQRKNVYEEALHRSEEERHEYDFHIEAIGRTIALLEPIANKIAQLSPEDRPVYKLKANLGGQGKSIHARVIKKIYGREAGLEVLQAMQENPVAAVPVVMHRLKQKEEEWKRAQREWNKVWREVDARNYARSLDHQGITFRLADKKAITTKALVSQIEVARDAARHRRASLIDPLFGRVRPRYHLAAALPDVLVLQDATKLALSYLDRTQGQIGAQERRRLEFFLRTFVPLFFGLDPEAFDRAFVVYHQVPVAPADTSISAVPAEGDAGPGDDAASSVGDDAEGGSAASGTASSKRGKRGGGNAGGTAVAGGDLRKKLLKSEQAKSTNRKRGGQDGASPVPSRFASPAVSETAAVSGALVTQADTGIASGSGAGSEEGKDEVSPSTVSKRPSKSVFFANTTFYALLRLFEILYSRLSYFKELAIELAEEASPSPAKRRKLSPPESADRTTVSSSSTTAASSTKPAHAEHLYDIMLESCERLFDNEIEVHAFEDQMRALFGNQEAYRIFTIDKVIGALIKQVQIVLVDSRSQELFELLKRDRVLAAPTMQDMMNSRRAAEKTLGPDENIFRIDWIQDAKMMTIQLLGKNDDTLDSEIMTERWQAYVDAFVSGESSEDLSPRARRPFLRKHVPLPNTPPPFVVADGALEMRVCVRTYRIFYVSHTEDFLCRSPRRSQSATAGAPDRGKGKTGVASLEEGETDFTKRLERKNTMRKRWMERVAQGEWPVPSKKDVHADGTVDPDKPPPSHVAAPT